MPSLIDIALEVAEEYPVFACNADKRPCLTGGFYNVCVANSYSRGDREFEKATTMLFPSEIAQRGRMRDHTAAPFRRRVTV